MMSQPGGQPPHAGPIRLGIVGAGRVAELVHLPALRAVPDFRIVAIAEPDAERRARIGALVSGAAVHEDASTLLDRDDLDAVAVCTPPAEHASLAIAAFARRRHVYLEKPIALSLADADAVVEAWRAAGTVGMTGFNFRFHPLVRELRALVAAGTLGRIIAVRTTFGSAPRPLPAWKQAAVSGGGVARDLVPHHADLVSWLLGSPVSWVAADIASVDSEADVALVRLGLASGVVAQCTATGCARDAHVIEVIGTAATARIDRASMRRVELRPTRDRHPRLDRLARAVAALDPRLHLTPPWREPSHRAAWCAFADAVRGRRGAIPDLQAGRDALAVVLAAETAAVERSVVAIASHTSRAPDGTPRHRETTAPSARAVGAMPRESAATFAPPSVRQGSAEALA